MASSASVSNQPIARPSARPFKAFALVAVLAVAVYFVAKYVFHYYLHYDQATFTDYWPKRGWLLLHISAGMVALLTGPLQFSARLRKRYLKLHRIIGRVYLIAVALGSIAAFRLAWTTTSGWAWGFGVAMLGVAWITTSGMAYYAILRRQMAIHKEWMVRSYVVTFAFVTFRLLEDMGPTSHLMPENDRSISAIWACWALPLLITEVILQLRRISPPAKSRS